MSSRQTVVAVERLTNTHVGNPRWRVRFADGSSAITADNIMDGYAISQRWVGEPVDVSFTIGGLISGINLAP